MITETEYLNHELKVTFDEIEAFDELNFDLPYRWDSYDYDQVKDLHTWSIFLRVNKKIIGMLIVVDLSGPVITSIAVNEEYRGKGLALYMFKKFALYLEKLGNDEIKGQECWMNKIKEKDGCVIGLDVDFKNERAIRLYKYIGFKEEEDPYGFIEMAKKSADDFGIGYQINMKIPVLKFLEFFHKFPLQNLGQFS